MKPKVPSRVDQVSTPAKGGPSHDQDVLDDGGDRADGAGDERRLAGSGAHLPQDDLGSAGGAAGRDDAVSGAQACQMEMGRTRESKAAINKKMKTCMDLKMNGN